jgi:SAM-dependent methyltransferase
MPPHHSDEERLIDTEQLVAELRARVERQRAAGRYGDDDVLSADLEPVEPSPAAALSEDARQIVYRPEVGYSSRPVVGPILTAFKRFFYRIFFYPLDDLARQTDDAVRRLSDVVASDAASREASLDAVRFRIDTLVNQLELAHRMTAERVTALEESQERLQLPSRLARLERGAREPRQPAPATSAPPPAALHATDQQLPSFDYMTFENRFRPEKTVVERHGRYVDLLRTQDRVLEIGCGRGELLELLRDEGVSAYGVEIDPDFVAISQDKGLDVREGDGVTHVEVLEEGAVDGIIASHVIEHLKPALLWRLVSAAAEKLGKDGVLIFETPNPESVVAGSINFHRDPTHVRPVHPDTLTFLCESAGFREVEIRRLEPVPTEFRLPDRPVENGPLAEHVSEVVRQLNELIYGYQDYALIARV